MNPFALNDQVAIITGGGSGIGESIARIFAESGATVHIIDINQEGTDRVVNNIRHAGNNAFGHMGNVVDQQSMIEICQRVIDESKSIDIVIGNAGISQIGTLDQTTEEDLDAIYQVNIKGVYNILYAAIPHMKKQHSGVILNLASIASSIALPDRFGYSMSKGAVLNMTYTIARDYLEYNIRCNCIAPGRVHTPFVDDYLAKNYPGKEKEMYDKLSKTQPIGRMGTPDEIAFLALYLCSEKASFITGTNFPIDGGMEKLFM